LKVGQPMIISAPIYLAVVLDVIFIFIICLIGKKIVGQLRQYLVTAVILNVGWGCWTPF
jgi:purine-cytosine permease-like protein